jgi:hypothetical protein
MRTLTERRMVLVSTRAMKNRSDVSVTNIDSRRSVFRNRSLYRFQGSRKRKLNLKAIVREKTCTKATLGSKPKKCGR